jgi:hypothetical protein
MFLVHSISRNVELYFGGILVVSVIFLYNITITPLNLHVGPLRLPLFKTFVSKQDTIVLQLCLRGSWFC